MTTTKGNGMTAATAGPDQGSAPGVLPITRRGRTVGVVLLGPDGGRWQSTTDVERVVTVATLTGGVVAAIGLVAAAVRRPRVQRITMGPGGWVSFRGPSRPRPRSPHRPWWARLLGARPVNPVRRSCRQQATARARRSARTPIRHGTATTHVGRGRHVEGRVASVPAVRPAVRTGPERGAAPDASRAGGPCAGRRKANRLR